MSASTIARVRANNKKRCIEIEAGGQPFSLPYVRLKLKPTPGDRIAEIFIDKQLARRAITYRLESGKEDSVHLDAFLDYNKDPRFMQDLLKHQLTLVALDLIQASGIARAELRRRLQTSPAQVERLLDPANSRKSIDQMLRLMTVLGCEVSFAVDVPSWPRRMRSALKARVRRNIATKRAA